jgi:hypothetical protein
VQNPQQLALKLLSPTFLGPKIPPAIERKARNAQAFGERTKSCSTKMEERLQNERILVTKPLTVVFTSS